MRAVPIVALLTVGVLGPGGCAAPAAERTTALRGTDLVLATDTVAQALGASDFLQGRGPQSPPIVLRPDPMENLSDTRLTPGDAWAAMARVLFASGMIELCRGRGVVVQMPPLATEGLARAGITINEPAAELAPTHVLRARLRSLTRAGSAAGRLAAESAERKDTYLFEYTIVDLATRGVVWAGSAELARVARGSVVD